MDREASPAGGVQFPDSGARGARASVRAMKASCLVIGAMLLAAGPRLGAQPSAPPSACSRPEYRQFDFWIGDWDVYDPKGALAGRNVVTREFGGCVLQEHWTAAGPMAQTGSSFNTWSPARQQWHQTWVD